MTVLLVEKKMKRKSGQTMKHQISEIFVFILLMGLITTALYAQYYTTSYDNIKEVATLKGHRIFVYSVVFSPDGKFLASGSADDTIKLWDIFKKSEIATLKGHSGDVWSVAFSPDGKILASGSSDKTINLWMLNWKDSKE